MDRRDNPWSCCQFQVFSLEISHTQGERNNKSSQNFLGVLTRVWEDNFPMGKYFWLRGGRKRYPDTKNGLGKNSVIVEILGISEILGTLKTLSYNIASSSPSLKRGKGAAKAKERKGKEGRMESRIELKFNDPNFLYHPVTIAIKPESSVWKIWFKRLGLRDWG